MATAEAWEAATSYYLCDQLTCVVKWADHWQSGIAIPVAVFAVLVPTFLEIAKRRGRFNAVRASLQMTISLVSHYAATAAENLSLVRNRPDSHGTFEQPQIPSELIDRLEKAIEALGRPLVAIRLHRMIGEMQVLDARMGRVRPLGESVETLDSYMLQAATIYAQANSLFDFARLEAKTTTARLTWDEVRAGLKLAGVRKAAYPDVHAKIDRYEENKTDPEVHNQVSRHNLRFLPTRRPFNRS